MKIVFAGTPEFAALALQAIDDAGHEIVLALTQPDRRAGRGMHLQASPVKTLAIARNIPVLQPETLRLKHADIQMQATALAAYQRLAQIDFDAMVVVAYGLILPQEILDLAAQNGRYGCFNIHASLLPRWRGAAPIQRSIESGDKKTGISIMQMDAGLDTGDIVLSKEIVISSQETAASLHDRLAKLGAQLMVDVLHDLDQGKTLTKIVQPNEGISYAEKILKSEAEINWQLSAAEIDRRIRAFNPFPGSTSTLNGELLKFWNSAVASPAVAVQSKTPGEILASNGNSIYVQCGEGIIEILEMQKAGGKKLAASQCVLMGGELSSGAQFKTCNEQEGGVNV